MGLRDLLKLDGRPRCKARCPIRSCSRRCSWDDDHSGSRHYCSKHGRF